MQELKDIRSEALQTMLAEEQQDHSRRPLPDDLKAVCGREYAFVAGLPATYDQDKEINDRT